jgi:hypothetical protein
VNKERESKESREASGLPTREQSLLLKASLQEKDAAIDAWYEWKSSVDVDRLDEGSHLLLPLLYRNLNSHGVVDPLMRKFKGVYRLTWYKNHLLFHHIVRIVRALQQAGIETMVLKGAALILTHYRDYGLCPMQDFDLLVPTRQLSSAIGVLKEENWTSLYWLPMTISDAFTCLRQSYQFTDRQGREFDLHWHVLWECCEPNADDDFWSAASEVQLDGRLVWVLCPTDQLLHTCVHGALGNTVPTLRWIADAMAILKTAVIDWDRLVAQTHKRRLILQVRNTLSYLHDVMSVPVPQPVLQMLKEMPTSYGERIDYRIYCRPSNMWGVTDKAWLHFRQSAKWAQNTGSHRILGLPQYFQIYWGLDRAWHFPFQMVYRAVRKGWRGNILERFT